jgi:TonB family protein
MKTPQSLILMAALIGCSSHDPMATRAPRSLKQTTCNVAAGNRWVVVRFDVTADGNVADPMIIQSCPPGKFDSRALDYVGESKYQPTKSGRRGVMLRVEFSPTGEPTTAGVDR